MIFLLDWLITKCSGDYCDEDLELIREIAQMLCTAKAMCDNGGKKLEPQDLKVGTDMPEQTYDLTHGDHPWVVAIRMSKACFTFAAELGMRLCEVYTERYKRTHASQNLICILGLVGLKFPQQDLAFKSDTLVAPVRLDTWGWRYNSLFCHGEGCEFLAPLCVPKECAVRDSDGTLNPVESYRKYYIEHKADMAKWDHSKVPSWWPTPQIPPSVVKAALLAKEYRNKSFKSISRKKK